MQTGDFKQLKVWQRAMDLTEEIYRLVKFLPLLICNRLALIPETQTRKAQSFITEIGKMLNGLISYRLNQSNS